MSTHSTSADARLEAIFPGLHALAPERLSFAPDVEVRAYLLERPQGDLLVYNTGAVARSGPALAAAGGVGWHYLNHWHEALPEFDLPGAAAVHGVPIVAHAADAGEVERRSGVKAVTFDHAGPLGAGFDILPVPGHTPGSTAFVWDHDGRRFLFTGDQVSLRGDEWVAAVLASSDRAAYLESLERLRALEFDVLVPWASTAGGASYAPTDRDDARRRLGEIAERVAAGADS